MDNGADNYRRFLDGDDKGIVEIVGDYKDGLILYLNGYVNNIYIAEELTEDTFFRLITKKPRFSGKSSFIDKIPQKKLRFQYTKFQNKLQFPEKCYIIYPSLFLKKTRNFSFF